MEYRVRDVALFPVGDALGANTRSEPPETGELLPNMKNALFSAAKKSKQILRFDLVYERFKSLHVCP